MRGAVERALAEDLTPLGDLTATLVPDSPGEARFAARQGGRLAGTLCAQETFAQLDPDVEVSWSVAEGTELAPGEVFGMVRGPFRSILTGERTALNFLGHLSGIATMTARYVEVASTGGPARVWDTRKTVPGLRALAKAAVRAGGGRNHRGNLSDWMLIKDNHLGGISITNAVLAARDRWPGRTVHVECDSTEQCSEALQAGADSILLDNMTPEQVRGMCGDRGSGPGWGDASVAAGGLRWHHAGHHRRLLRHRRRHDLGRCHHQLGARAGSGTRSGLSVVSSPGPAAAVRARSAQR